ncbi:hypothetical protein [Sulfurimonas autotrophica]|uniref:Uncharacterized protein n=1 Tax=Sulfurimonas autotrophica (strain ATCC BAA-671 / DSM 16294 / JCM 11897 / OK10) TaxID=563040 RepID=E0UPI7_SULAO|nr:hypothetical protein [Sulfurimonas autotrophica]ADN09717.1 hypothetical protein Saut_1671 [Sulfurimonas autotrophica DSM 16294]
MQYVSLFLLTFLFSSILLAQDEDITILAKKLNLYGGQKAAIQWNRIFSSQRHLKKYKLEKLPIQTRNKLQKYLISHAADSEQPIVPGLQP